MSKRVQSEARFNSAEREYLRADRKRMTIEELYNYLCSPQFLDEKSGNIFYNYYIYQYPANKEYEMRRQIQAQ